MICFISQILVKSILRQKSFRNPFSPGHFSRGERYKQSRSNSAPESYDHMRYWKYLIFKE